MNTKLLIALLLISLLATANGAKLFANQVPIRIHWSGGDGQPVKVSTPNVFTLEPIILAQNKLDANGKVVLAIPITQPLFVDLQVGTNTSTVLLNPGDSLEVTFTKQESHPFSFSGKGAQAATFLTQSSSVWHSFEMRGGRHLLQLEPQEFVSRLDSVQSAYDKLAQDSPLTSATLKASRYLVERKNTMQLLGYKLNYCLARFDLTDPSVVMPLALKNVFDEVPFDASLLKANMYEYGFVLTMYLQGGVYRSLFMGKSKAQIMVIQKRLIQLVDQQIYLKDYPSPIKTFLRAKNLDASLSQEGITAVADSILTILKKEPSYTAYDSVIQKKYDNWLALSPGKTAPNFSGTTLDGNTLSLTDLKGKIVYIDVWATWCVPCLEELPDSKILQKRFADNDWVAFLYVSIDRNKEAWKKMVGADSTFKGHHINLPPSQGFDSFWAAYQLSGIPRYILIDQAGKLVNVNADRPSSDKVGGVIEGLLSKTR